MDANTTSPVELIPAAAQHIPAITQIYAHHVLYGKGSFEETPPSDSQMRERFDAIQSQGYPYLVAMLDNVVVGFAYAGPHKARSAYRFTVEDTIYVSPDHMGKRIGSKLLQAIITLCEQGDYKTMIAVIGDRNNTGSIELHKAAGFELIGIAKSLGFKHGEWLDSVFMQRPLKK